MNDNGDNVMQTIISLSLSWAPNQFREVEWIRKQFASPNRFRVKFHGNYTLTFPISRLWPPKYTWCKGGLQC